MVDRAGGVELQDGGEGVEEVEVEEGYGSVRRGVHL